MPIENLFEKFLSCCFFNTLPSCRRSLRFPFAPKKQKTTTLCRVANQKKNIPDYSSTGHRAISQNSKFYFRYNPLTLANHVKQYEIGTCIMNVMALHENLITKYFSERFLSISGEKIYLKAFSSSVSLYSNLILGQIIDSNPTNVHKLAA